MIVEFWLHLWQIATDLAPSLLIGLLLAGLLHVYVPSDWIRRGLSGTDSATALRAALIGAPLPLCSCGVIPTALGLRREGASPGAATAFLISTPQTGVDSMLVSAAFLGWPFAIFKLVAAIVAGFSGGVLVNRFTAPEPPPPSTVPCHCCTSATTTPQRGLLAVLDYAVFDLLAALDRWLIFGVIAAALVTTLLPQDFFAGYSWSGGLLGMLVVVVISIPLYVCTTASVPIAAALVAAGLPAGSALVFLMAGPAVNMATIGAVGRTLGLRVTMLYLGTVVAMSLICGLLFDRLLATPTAAQLMHHPHSPDLIGVLSAVVLVGLLAWLALRRRKSVNVLA